MGEDLVTTLAGGAAVLAGLVWLAARSMARALAYDRRLDALRAVMQSGQRAPEGGTEGAGTGLRTLVETLVRIASVVAPIGGREREKIGRLLRDAGLGHPDALPRYLAVKGAVGIAAGAGAWMGLRGMEQTGGLLIALMAAAGAFVVGGMLTERVVRWLARRRTLRMSGALPDALDLVVMCREAGLTFERALETVADEFEAVEPALAREFSLFEKELQVGGARRQAVTAFAERTPIEGIRSLAFVLIQSDRYGTPLTESLANIAGNERSQRAARVVAQAERLPVLITLPTLLFVLPGTVLLVAGPAFLTAIKAIGQLGG